MNHQLKSPGVYEFKPSSFRFIKAVDNDGGYKEDIDLDFNFTLNDFDDLDVNYFQI